MYCLGREGRETKGSPTLSFIEALKKIYVFGWLILSSLHIVSCTVLCTSSQELRINSESRVIVYHLFLNQQKHSSRQWEEMLMTYSKDNGHDEAEALGELQWLVSVVVTYFKCMSGWFYAPQSLCKMWGFFVPK